MQTSAINPEHHDALAVRISRWLFAQDPMHTCCVDNDAVDEYDAVARYLVDRLAEGDALTVALHAALALLERRRCVKLPADACRLPWGEQLARAQARVCEHMAESGGELRVWGRIPRYQFCYAGEHKLEIAPSGEVLGDASGRGLPQARVTFKGKPVSLVNDDRDDAT
jgi:hypothetical protein